MRYYSTIFALFVQIVLFNAPSISATPSTTPTGISLDLSIEQQLSATGLGDVVCSVEQNGYTFRVFNGLALPMTYRVLFDCEDGT